ncbi:hypothetical protein [Flavobacterium soli]|uniref:hypothetical protein n=1 Tax=Flavobacterium soli TaxID=344881 RepID=UPI0004162B60|nr:hypothetical protein [Flavobacterium soli]
MKKLVVLFFFCLQVLGQNNTANDSLVKTNPILFAEIFGGFGGGTYGGAWSWSLALNYQFNEKDLLTARYSGVAVGKRDNIVIGFSAIPVFVRKESLEEYAVLYGKRWIDDGFSVSVSSGISFVNRNYYEEMEDRYEKLNEDFFGVPIEVSLKWFKSKKSRFRAYYGIIPIGKKKVAFGRSFGFKLSGNMAKSSYFGIGISYGFGLHKNY